jgi:hypothetical protein
MRKLFFLMPLFLLFAGTASACGGLFCSTTPVNQQGEQIIFEMNDDGTISAYVQINYTGAATNFAWVVPVPTVPEVDVADMATFDELDLLTQPVFIPPPLPACFEMSTPTQMLMGTQAPSPTYSAAEVTILAQGTAGPYEYSVITDDDPDEMFRWLRENGYQIAPAMGPLIRVYNDEDMVFLAMKLQPEAGVQDIQPIKMTYESDAPMIPIRLTAVAANPNMSILTWIFADEQAYPANYEQIEIANEELRGDMATRAINYLPLLDARIDTFLGLAMITEYAQPTSDLAQRVQDPLLQQLAQEHRYLTRLYGRISPEEMTIDPVFMFNGQLPNFSNVRDLSNMDSDVFWGCRNAGSPKEGGFILTIGFVAGFGAWRVKRQFRKRN